MTFLFLLLNVGNFKHSFHSNFSRQAAICQRLTNPTDSERATKDCRLCRSMSERRACQRLLWEKFPFSEFSSLMYYIYCRHLSTQLSFIAFFPLLRTSTNILVGENRIDTNDSTSYFDSISLPRSIIEFMNFIIAISEGFRRSNSIYDHFILNSGK